MLKDITIASKRRKIISMTKTVSRNSSNVFMSFTAEQLLVLEEILEKEISYYVRNRAFQQFVKDGDLLSI
jgi:hypothetical protein